MAQNYKHKTGKCPKCGESFEQYYKVDENYEESEFSRAKVRSMMETLRLTILGGIHIQIYHRDFDGISKDYVSEILNMETNEQ